MMVMMMTMIKLMMMVAKMVKKMMTMMKVTFNEQNRVARITFIHWQKEKINK